MAIRDFNVKRLRTSVIIGSGSSNGGSPHTMIYSASVASNFQGGINPNYPIKAVGADVGLFVSGAVGSRAAWIAGTATKQGGTTLIGGDLYVSGAIEGSSFTGVNSSGSFNVPSPGEFVTTASVSIAGTQGFSYTADQEGTDTYFFVSGSQTRSGSADRTFVQNPAVSVFGGDLVVSGTLYAERQVIEVDKRVDGAFFVSGAAEIEKSLTVKGTKTVGAINYVGIHLDDTSASAIVWDENDALIAENLEHLHISSSKSTTFNYPLGGLVYEDVSFYVSGGIGSVAQRGVHRGTALFGGDLVTSGALYVNGFTNPGNAGAAYTAIVLNSPQASAIVWDSPGNTDPAENDAQIYESGGVLHVSGTDGVLLSASGSAGGGDIRMFPAGEVEIISKNNATFPYFRTFVRNSGTDYEQFRTSYNGVYVNMDKLSTSDFHVRGNNRNLLVLTDAGTDQVILGAEAGTSAATAGGNGSIAVGADVGVYLSGSTGGKFINAVAATGELKSTIVAAGDLVVSGTMYAEINAEVTGTLGVSDNVHLNPDKKIFFAGNSPTGPFIHSPGSVDLTIDADNILTFDYDTVSRFKYNNVEQLEIGSSGFIWNDNNVTSDSYDFRVQGGPLDGAIIVDAGTSQVILGTDGTEAADAGGNSTAIGTDVSVYLSGTLDGASINSSDGEARSTIVSAGDHVVSGTVRTNFIQSVTGPLNIKAVNTNDSDIVFTVDDGGFDQVAFTIDGSETASSFFTPAANGFLRVDDGQNAGRSQLDGNGGLTLIKANSSGISNPPAAIFQRYRGTLAIQQPVQNGDQLGSISMQGYDGGNVSEGVVISAEIGTGSIAVSRLPTDLLFKTRTALGGAVTTQLKLNSTGITEITGSAEATLGLSGSLTQLVDGTSYLRAGSNITIASASNGAVTISSTGGGTTDTLGWSAPGSGQILTTGSLQINDVLTANGNVSLGVDSAQTISINGAIGTNILPSADSTYNLGSASKRWANIYTGDLHLRNDKGDWTIQEEADDLIVINNRTGKKYKMMLSPLEDSE